MPLISIIVISYNTRDLTRECLSSIYKTTHKTDFEVIVVDNNSSDGSREMLEKEFPQSRRLLLDENAGFAGANNIAAREATGDYFLLLNPDTVVLDNAIDTLVEFAVTHSEYRLYGGATSFADGSRNPTSGWMMSTGWSLFVAGLGLSSVFRASRFFNPESLMHHSWEEPFEVDIVTGCFLLIDTKLWRLLDGFDTDFFMYGEDADLSLRARSVGARPILVPEAKIIHHGGASEHVRADKMIRLFRAKLRLFRKHWTSFGARYARLMLQLYVLTRLLAFGLHTDNTWKQIWSRRTEWL